MNGHRLHVVILSAFLLASPAHLALGGIRNANVEFLPDMVTDEVDYIFYGANIITLDEQNPLAEAIATKTETIVAVGTDEELLETYHTKNPINTIDLNGLTIMPGFVDGHTHMLGSALWTGLTNLTHAQDIALSYGYTTIVEKSVTDLEFEPLLLADQAGELRLRVNMFPCYNAASLDEERETIILEMWYNARPPILEHDAMLRVPGIKIFADGAGIGDRGAPAVSVPYSPEAMEYLESVTDSEYGDLYLDQQELNTAVKSIQDAGFRAAFHTMGDRAIETVLNAIEYALDGESNSIHRHQIEHNSFLKPDLITKADQLDTLHSVRGYFPTYWQSENEDWYNSTVCEWYVNRYSLPDLGIHSYWETDFSWAVYGNNSTSRNINPFLHLWGFVTRSAIDENGTLHRPVPWVAEHEISVIQALRMMTIDAAYIVSQEDYIGTLESGKFADLIVISDSPLDVNADELKDLEVYVTMVGGNIEYVKDGSDFADLTITPVLPSFLLPTLVVIPIVVLLVLIVLRKYHH
ncbi:MAG: amidohydrolase [Candidatus Sifarchaeia archaeon]